MNKAENEKREVQDAIDEVDELYDPLLGSLDMVAHMEDNMDSELFKKKQAAKQTSRGSRPKETGDYGDPGETRDPGEVLSSGCSWHEQAVSMTTGGCHLFE